VADGTGIEWTDATWNPIRGCRRVSPGCQHCYAETVAARFAGEGQPYEGLIDDHGRWNGRVREVPHVLDQPLRWRRPRSIFVNSMSDLFHDSLTNEQIAAIFGVMMAARWHRFQTLTKRAERMRDWFAWLAAEGVRAGERWVERVADAERKCGEPVGSRGANVGQGPMLVLLHAADAALHAAGSRKTITGFGPTWPLPNVHLGVSIEDARHLHRADLLAECPAAVRWWSAEPLLGDLDALGSLDVRLQRGKVDWIVVGGESGDGARPMHPQWARTVRDRAVAAGVPFFFKQWGAFAPANGGPGGDLYDVPMRDAGFFDYNDRWNTGGANPFRQSMTRLGKALTGRLLDGREWNEVPDGR
jgi:protein gp37